MPPLNVLVEIPKEKFFDDAAFCRHMHGNCRLIRWPPNLGVGGYCLQLFGELWFQRLTGSRRMTKALFSFQQNLQNFLDFPSHQIFRHMHEALNIDKK
jgi:hypothetical protein